MAGTIQSLQNTAAMAGVSLEQLATSLESPVNRQEVALRYYQAEIGNLYTRAMLMAHFDPAVAHDHRSAHRST